MQRVFGLVKGRCQVYFRPVKTTILSVSLTLELKKFIEGKVQSGRYQDSSDVIRAALPAFERSEASREDSALEDLIQEGLDSGPAVPVARRTWDEIWAESDQIARAGAGQG